jgi:isocitrate dehydrogenase (NAD+)
VSLSLGKSVTLIPGDGCCIFEAVHGTVPDIAGKGTANPTALLRSAILMQEALTLSKLSNSIDRALRRVLREGKDVTRDLGGTATKEEMCQAIIRYLH